jgi:uncharacterized membrane protein
MDLLGFGAAAASSATTSKKGITNQQPAMTWQRDLLLRSIKILDIGYITTVYFLLAFFLSSYIDKKLGAFDEKAADKKKTITLIIECIIHVYLIGVLVYVVRNLMEFLPFPLDGYQGFIHLKVKELTNATVFVFIFLIFQYNLRGKLNYIRKRVFSA